MSENLHETAEYGAQVQAFLENPIWGECYEALRAEYLNEFFATENAEGRERVYEKMNILIDVLEGLRGYVVAGKAAEEQIKALEGHMRLDFRDVPVVLDDDGNVLRAN